MKRLNSRLRSILINLDTRFQSIIIGILVGICCGLAAVGLTYGLERFSRAYF